MSGNNNYTPWYQQPEIKAEREVKLARKTAYADGRLHGYVLGAICGIIFTVLTYWSF